MSNKEDTEVMDSKINELKSLIEEKNKELYNELVQAILNNDEKSMRYVQSKQIQCQAEIRLLNHLKSNDNNTNFVIC